ncbi:thermonuclease family protein [Devosia sp. A369]
MKLRGYIAGTLLLLVSQSSADEVRVIQGPAEALNADIVKIGQDRVVLWGIDAPEPDQNCRANGRNWGCFDAALRTLQALIASGPVTCFTTTQSDPFNRFYAICEVGGVDINAQMVKAGMALAFPKESDAYTSVQVDAIMAGVGLWQPGVEFQPPWEWREIQSPGGYK